MLFRSLPMPGGDAVKPVTQAPWILVGGSYSGALTGWTLVKSVHFPSLVVRYSNFDLRSKPGLFQAGYASSAVVESIV